MIYHIDTDVGVDDALALVLAQRLFGPALVSLSTVFGNVPVETATRSARIIRRLLGRAETLPIWTGAECASDGRRCDARHVHGEDGLGGATRDVPKEVLAAVAAEAEPPALGAAARPSPPAAPVTIIALGPATNVPALMALFGAASVSRIVLLGGVLYDEGNITPEAEFNARCDPAALAQALALGVPTMLVPLDVCRKVQVTRAWMEAATVGSGPLPALLRTAHRRYMDHYEGWEGLDGCFPHDSVAVCLAARPDLVFGVAGSVDVDLADGARGRTRLMPGAGGTLVAMGGRLAWVRRTIAGVLDPPESAPVQLRGAEAGT